ncbi:hypothetical protein [Mesorhizobium sp.]|uniref:hypothetical protein n=1 Tax=Mesorhizobium sp. TaxID=1871066 RepID=UPI000FE7697F|nr:hypothetical protein [Mesorhizobium sp.]RWO85894.1 MAG: hypothetical protein EOQ95_23215 [Mesorhizobium sp.]
MPDRRLRHDKDYHERAVLPGNEAKSYLFDNWFDPIEAALRERVRGFIETMPESEFEAVLPVPGMAGDAGVMSDGNGGVAGHRHGSRTRTLTGTLGTTEITVPRTRLEAGEDKTGGMEEQGPARLSAAHATR